MTTTTARVSAWTVSSLAVVSVVATVILWPFAAEPTGGEGVLLALVLLIGLTFCCTGAVLVARLPANPIGWLLCAIGIFQLWNGFAGEYAVVAQRTHPGVLPFGELEAWAGAWTWMPSVFLLATFLLLLFPNGHPPTPRWRWVGWLAAIGMAIVVGGAMVESWHLRFDIDAIENGEISSPAIVIGLVIVVGAVIASIVSLVVRFRRATGDERQQLRWFTFAAIFMVVGLAIALTPVPWGLFLFALGFITLPVATAISILKYRLYDLDIVVKKTAVALLITLLIGVPSVLVLAIASQVLLWRGTGKLVTLIGGLLLGALLVPLIRVARRIADRIVYGRRASAYEVLTGFSQRMADTYASGDVLARMAEVLRAGTGAMSATVWLRVGGNLRAAAVAGTERRDDDDAFSVEVRHQGEPLGALSVTMPPDYPIDHGRERLVRDLASQAGLVLRNVRLIEDLKASRQRLVAAQDEERRKLERNIHDGAQQQLVALAVKQRLAASMVGRDDEGVRAMLEELHRETNDALQDLRDLARGIYPPLLADKGLAAALGAQARKAAMPVTVDADGIGRFSQDVEATVYFCTLEALNNVAKYADASRATVRLANGAGEITFEVRDDGRGFDPASSGYGTGLQGMADRLAALGGELVVTSAPGDGTAVAGRLPVGDAR